jgi:copper homeostasis protein (lipoprotein)
MNVRTAISALVPLILVAGGCSTTGGLGSFPAVRGAASYRERMAVPPGTQLEVLLLDVSRADAPAEVIGKTVNADAGQPPYRFEIPYQSDRIITSHRYAVRASLRHEGRLLFTTDRIYPVITGGHPTDVQLLLNSVPTPGPKAAEANGALDALPVTFAGDLPCADCEAIGYHLDLFMDGSFFLRTTYRGKAEGQFDEIGRWAYSSDGKTLLLHGGRDTPGRFAIAGPDALRMLSRDGEQITSNLNYTLRRTPEFTPIEPRLAMRGMYGYLADAATFMECLTGRKMQVAMAGDNRALEAAYTTERREPGEALLVTLEGRIVQRMPMEGSGPVPTLLPEKFIGIWPGETCGGGPGPATLLDTYWKLTRLGNAAVGRATNQREAHLVMRGDNRLAGSDGCNQMVGSYRLEGDRITFSQFASTMMACPPGAGQAHQLGTALAGVARYRIVGQHLEFLDGEGAMLARFEAVAPR